MPFLPPTRISGAITKLRSGDFRESGGDAQVTSMAFYIAMPVPYLNMVENYYYYYYYKSIYKAPMYANISRRQYNVANSLSLL